MNNLTFMQNTHLTLGVELELQLINLHSLNLAMEAKDFLRRLSALDCPGELKPEITQSMIELNSSIHFSYPTLLAELSTIRDVISKEAAKTHIGVCGGGVHAFQKWQTQRISEIERFASVSDQYGFLAKQFTVFGQHIHLACQNGDDSLYLCHAMARYIPHFIALSAASPFNQGVDTTFDCSRLTTVSAFPLSGTPPWILQWSEFEKYFHTLFNLGVVKSMKDFYWDIRPKPDYGTVELRVCDTPLTVTKAAELAAYAQLLAHWLLESRPNISQDIYLTYAMNRFRASRYGLSAKMIDPIQQKEISIVDDIIQTFNELERYYDIYKSRQAILKLQSEVLQLKNDASWLRNVYSTVRTLNDTVRLQTQLWMNSSIV